MGILSLRIGDGDLGLFYMSSPLAPKLLSLTQ